MNPHISKLILLILSFNHHQIVVTTALNINLSSLWNLFGYDENSNSNDRSKLIFPKRDLIQELGGKDHYRNLVRHALAMDSSNDSDDSDDSNDGGGVTPVYGVDVGFPMQHAPSNDDADSSTDDNINDNSNDDSISTGDGNSNSDEEHITNLKKHQSKLYRNYIQGCNQYYSSTKACDNAEKDRFDMNLNQPPVMQNYTMLGFQKTKIPQDLFKQLKIFWKKHSHKQKMEAWGKRGGEEVGSDTQGSGDDNMVQVQADTHVNHWSSPTYMVHIDNPYFQGGGMELKNYIWHVARQALQNWINNGGGNGISNGMSDLSNNNMDVGDETKWTLSPTSMYGIRVYKTGSILAPHVDRLPLVTSAIINVDQDVDEDWPLEVIGHDGVAYNITMEPGDMLLYESHSIIHGRPYPLKGRYYANIFVHFEPSGHCMRHAERMKGEDVAIDDAKVLYERAQKRLKQKQDKMKAKKRENKGSASTDKVGDQNGQEKSRRAPSTPYYIQPGSIEKERWNQEVMYDMNLNEIQVDKINVNVLAGKGKLGDIMYAFQLDPQSVLAKDNNGWQPLHEAVRSGYITLTKFLVEQGKADVNARTGDDDGGSALWWALKYHDEDHPVVEYLKEHGAVKLAPGEKRKMIKEEGKDEL